MGQGSSRKRPLYLRQLSHYKQGLSLFVHASSRPYVFVQSFPVLFHCGSGEHFCFVCLVLMVGKSSVYSGGFQLCFLFVDCITK